MSESKKTIGIVGGMGPLASCDLFRKILEVTDASCDQEHMPVLMDNNTKIPDRGKFILAGGEDPVPEMLRSARRLEEAGADLLVMPCNTAHYFYDRLSTQVGIPFLSILEETSRWIVEHEISAVGILATSGTVSQRLYHDPLEKAGVRVLTPTEEQQKEVDMMIYDIIKAGKDLPIDGFKEVLASLEAQGAERFLLGCTEIPLAFTRYDLPGEVVDTTLCLAMAAVREAGGRLRQEYRD